MTPTHLSQNLNAKLSPRPRTRGDQPVATRLGTTASRGASPPPRIVGAKSRYQGGYRINV